MKSNSEKYGLQGIRVLIKRQQSLNRAMRQTMRYWSCTRQSLKLSDALERGSEAVSSLFEVVRIMEEQLQADKANQV